MQRYLSHSDSIEILTWFEGVGERGHLLLSGKGGRGGGKLSQVPVHLRSTVDQC